MAFGDGPLIVQSDKTVLLEIDHALADEARAALAPFAELERAPEHVHTYRITPLAVWNARAAGHDAEQLVDVLECYSRFPVPHALLIDVVETMSRYGRVKLHKHPAHGLILESAEPAIIAEITRHKKIAPMLGATIDDTSVVVHPSERGRLKQELLKVGWPAEDLAGYVDGEAHPIALEETDWSLRDYQRFAADSFWEGGSGVVVLPCGAGKTMVGAAAMAKAQATTLILVTIATYQVVTRKTKGEYRALELFDSRDWGLIIYDEVHLLPAPVFRMTSDLQSRRRLGLTATLVREDGLEGDVFSLIGPKRYDAPWKDIEAQGYIAAAECVEVRVTMTKAERMAYATAERSVRYRLAACAETKNKVVKKLVEQHKGEPTLVIGAYIDQLEELGGILDAPIIDGKTSNKKREELFDAFRKGTLNVLVVSKVANFSIDLPEAAVAIQVSGTFGSRQEEAQRLGRLLRPKANGREALFYTVVSRDTLDTEYAAHRQRFLAEQGYAYRIVDADDLLFPIKDN